MKAALYVRVSTHHQIDKDSLPFQRKELINYAQYALNIQDVEVFEDAGYSAKNTDRPAFQQMIARIRNKEFTHLVVWKIDRISRNLRDFSEMYDELKDYNVTFISKNEQFDTSSAMGEAMLKIILVFAELERKITAERVSSIMLSRAEKGLWNGANCPLGYKWDEESKFPVVDLNEAKVIKYIYSQYEQTHSALQVMKLLNQNGFKTKRGGEWSSKTVVDIIRNPFYKGTYRYNYRAPGRGKIKDESEWIIKDDNHTAIISTEQWNKCNLLMDKNAQRNTSEFRGNVYTHIFSNILKCADCGRVFIAGRDRPRNDGYTPSKYRCQGRMRGTECTAKMVSDDKICAFVLKYISNFMNSSMLLNEGTTLDEFEKMLLNGLAFKNVKGMDRMHLNTSFMTLLYHSNKDMFYTQIDTLDNNESNEYEYEILKKEKDKIERALERLKKLFLFDEDGLSEKDFLLQQKQLKDKLAEINITLKNSKCSSSLHNISDLQKISNLVILRKISSPDNIDLRVILANTEKEIVKDFIHSIIKEIVIKDGQIISILFNNGLINRFLY